MYTTELPGSKNRLSFSMFDTAIGRCALAWTDEGIAALQLPEITPAHTARAVCQRIGDMEAKETAQEPAWVLAVIKDLQRHLSGENRDFSDIPLDLKGVTPFQRRVYEAARGIKPGETRSYGQLAREVGSPGAARAVGRALGANPVALIVPCHRVLGSNGQPTGFSAYGGCQVKLRLLSLEGSRSIRTKGCRSAFLDGAGAGQGSPGLRFHPGKAANCSFDSALAVETLCRSDSHLARLIEQVGPFALELDEMLSPFEALAESIVYQQLTAKAASTIFGRVKAIWGGRALAKPEQILETGPAALAAAGLSRSKAAALRDLSLKQIEGAIPTLAEMQVLNDEEIIERLTAVRGVGRWTAEMFLIFRLGRPDVLPLGDLGVRKGFARTFGKKQLPTPRQLELRGRRWQPFRTVASWYLWRALDLP